MHVFEVLPSFTLKLIEILPTTKNSRKIPRVLPPIRTPITYQHLILVTVVQFRSVWFHYELKLPAHNEEKVWVLVVFDVYHISLFERLRRQKIHQLKYTNISHNIHTYPNLRRPTQLIQRRYQLHTLLLPLGPLGRIKHNRLKYHVALPKLQLGLQLQLFDL